MNLNKFTDKSKEALTGAQNIAIENGNNQVDQEHMLLALLIKKKASFKAY